MRTADAPIRRTAMMLAALIALLPAYASAADRLEVGVDKTIVLDLNRPASVVSIANPNIADVNVQSPNIIIVTGKALGTTSLDLLDDRKNPVAAYEVVVTPDTTDQVTINHGAAAVKTLSCQPRCIRISNPGKDSEPGSAGGAGTAGGKGGGVLSQLGGAPTAPKK